MLDGQAKINALKKLGKYYIASLKKELITDGNKASGKLERSLKADVSGDSLNIIGDQYLTALSEGKKATNKNPSKDMVSRIANWMRYKNMSALARGRGGRFRKRSENTKRMAAYVIAKKINRSTWKGSDVLERAYVRIENTFDKELTTMYREEISKSIQKFINNSNK